MIRPPPRSTLFPNTTPSPSAASHVGSYAINCTGAVDTDYSISYVTRTLTTNPYPLTITAVDMSKNYGAPLPAFTASYSGFVNRDTPSSLTTPPSCTTTPPAT